MGFFRKLLGAELIPFIGVGGKQKLIQIYKNKEWKSVFLEGFQKHAFFY